jgi:hypothetical protein
MRRRFRNPAPVPSGVGSGPAAVAPSPSPVSREEEEAKALIWKFVGTYEYPIGDPRNNGGWEVTPATDPQSNAPKKRGRPKGSKNRVKS